MQFPVVLNAGLHTHVKLPIVFIQSSPGLQRLV
jgi:hypothetical protein